MRLSLKVRLVFRKHNGLPHIPALQLIGSCPYRRAKKIRGLHILPCQQMLGKHSHGHIVQKSHIGRSQPEGNRVLIRHQNLLHVLIVGRILGSVFRIHNRFDGELHILCRKGLAVMPGNALLQMKRIGAGCLDKLPALRQTGHDLVFPVVGRQSVKEQQIDLPVLIHGRIDAGVVTAAVDKRARLSLRACCLAFVCHQAVHLLFRFLPAFYPCPMCIVSPTGC